MKLTARIDSVIEYYTSHRYLSNTATGNIPHTPTLKELHWLPIKQRVDYKLCLLVHKVVVGHAPSYLTGMLTAVADVPSRSTLRAASNGDYVVPRTRLKFGERVLRRCTSSVEPAANRTEVDTFHASFQALLENILL